MREESRAISLTQAPAKSSNSVYRSVGKSRLRRSCEKARRIFISVKKNYRLKNGTCDGWKKFSPHIRVMRFSAVLVPKLCTRGGVICKEINY